MKTIPNKPTVSPKVRLWVTIFMLVVTTVFLGFDRKRINELERDVSISARLLVAMKDTNTGIMEVEMGKHVIQHANDAACELFGYTHDELVGCPILALISDNLKDEHTASYLKRIEESKDPIAKKKNRVQAIKCEGKRRDGTPISLVIRLYIGNDSVIALVNTTEDSNYVPVGRGRTYEAKKETSTTSK